MSKVLAVCCVLSRKSVAQWRTGEGSTRVCQMHCVAQTMA